MNDSEKRRQQLLRQTRELYHDNRTVPAVHPRYGAAYRQIYGEEEAAVPGSFGIRLFVCVLLFVAFVSVDRSGSKAVPVSSSRIVNEITYDMDIAKVWKTL